MPLTREESSPGASGGRRPAHLKELHPDAGEHELQQRGDDHDVADGSDGDKHALDNVLQETGTGQSTRWRLHATGGGAGP